MNLYMFGYERVDTFYTFQKLLILANTANEAYKKATQYMIKLKVEDKFDNDYRINNFFGEIDIVDFQCQQELLVKEMGIMIIKYLGGNNEFS